jgi:hypothetical protein
MTFEDKRLKRLLAQAGLPQPELGLAGASPLKLSPVFAPPAAVAPVGPVQVPVPVPAAGAAPPPQTAGQEYAQNALLGFGLGATSESPIGAGIGAGLGLLGTYLNRRRAKPIRLAAGGAAKERKDYPRTRPPKKLPKGMGKATRGHKQF